MILFPSYNLGIVQGQDHDLISTPHDSSFVDPHLSLIIPLLVSLILLLFQLSKS
jgi:hypothetical protein